MENGFEPSMKKKILLVESNASIRIALQAALGAYGYELKTVETGEEGLRCVVDTPYDVVICNQYLPGISGLEFFSKAIKALPLATTILTSALGDDYLANKAYALDISAFLEKPFRIEHLLECIDGRYSRSPDERKSRHQYFSNWGTCVSITPDNNGECFHEQPPADPSCQRIMHRKGRRWRLFLNRRKMNTRPNTSPPQLEVITKSMQQG